MSVTKRIIIPAFIFLLVFSIVSRVFFRDFQNGWEAYQKKDYKTAFELWQPLAEKGDTRAQFFLGFMNDMGFGVAENDKEAVKWYRLAAEQGDSRAQLFLGFMYDLGSGIQEDNQEAAKWYKLAAEKGYEKAKTEIYNLAKENVPEALEVLIGDAENGVVEAQIRLVVMHQLGIGVPKDNSTLLKWYGLIAEPRLAKAEKHDQNIFNKKNMPQTLKILNYDAEKGSVGAQYSMGVIHQFGRGVPENDQEALKWYRLAAENDDENAKLLTGLMHQLGRGTPKNDQEALKWYRQFTKKRLDEEKVRVSKLAGKDASSFLKKLVNDAENGDSKAQFRLGELYQYGLGVTQDNQEAIKWYRIAAENGNSAAQLILGFMYDLGLGVPKDNQKALKWYRLVAKNRNILSNEDINKLSSMNVPQSIQSLTREAERGVTQAQYALGKIYASEQNKSRNYVLAHMWYNLSGLQGHMDATRQIQSIEKKMSQEEIEEAQTMVANWKPKQ
ncbi:MAG: sel1 repeat family protein [Nitrospinae bacterium]|nr:sel1 repeat family protein [Nitrospinota bacterium]